MIIHGFQKMTLVDFPGKVACILFTGHCSFRCPFCHNGSLVLDPESQPVVDNDEVFSYLERRRRMLDGVVVTGGEPTLQPDLIPFMRRIKDLGYHVKLDTNGYFPDAVEAAIESGCVDYIAMDVKNSLGMYAQTAGIPSFDPSRILRSISILMEGRTDYEFRTTVVRELHSVESIDQMGRMLKGARRHFLQSYVYSEDIIDPVYSAPTADQMERYSEILKTYIENVSIRDR
ncbi:MAG: anaerobic ribonucleoside-triphosphate reductase activating protein [Candidatus Ornithospirochaeta sp.]|nr:anaerobic ribonucleoside-triphosphate reductase activating protein [Candidatus Ornithospirochaeta sp.]